MLMATNETQSFIPHAVLRVAAASVPVQIVSTVKPEEILQLLRTINPTLKNVTRRMMKVPEKEVAMHQGESKLLVKQVLDTQGQAVRALNCRPF